MQVERLKFVLGRVENIEGEAENTSYQHFLLFPQCNLPNQKQKSLIVICKCFEFGPVQKNKSFGKELNNCVKFLSI